MCVLLSLKVWMDGVVPGEWKKAVVLPLYKSKGERSAFMSVEGRMHNLLLPPLLPLALFIFASQLLTPQLSLISLYFLAVRRIRTHLCLVPKGNITHFVLHFILNSTSQPLEQLLIWKRAYRWTVRVSTTKSYHMKKKGLLSRVCEGHLRDNSCIDIGVNSCEGCISIPGSCGEETHPAHTPQSYDVVRVLLGRWSLGENWQMIVGDDVCVK